MTKFYEVRVISSGRVKNAHRVYVDGKFIASFRTYSQAEAYITEMKKKDSMRENPARVDLPMLYGRVLRVEAKKTQPHVCDAGCRRANHCYFHDFKSGVAEYGLPAGTRLLLPSGVEFRLSERSLLLTTKIR